MKLTVDAKSFVESATWAIKSFDSKGDKAFVALVVNDEGQGFLSHSNNTSYMKSPLTVLAVEFDAGEKSPAQFALDGKFLQRLAGALSAETGPVVFSRKSNDVRAALDVKSSSGKFTIPLADARVPAEPKLVTIGEVEDVEYFDSLQRLAKLCDPVNAGFLPAIGAVDLYLNQDEKTLTFMATDRYALGEIVIDFEPAATGEDFFTADKHALLPYENAVLIAPTKGSSGTVTLVNETKGQKFGYSFADGRIALFSLSNTKPLVYGPIKDSASKNIDNYATLLIADLKKALGIVSSLAWDEAGIYFELSDKGLIVTDSNNSNKFTVPVQEIVTEGSHRVKFIRSVITEAFNPVSTASLKLRWADASKAFVLEPLLDDGSVQENVFILAIPSVN